MARSSAVLFLALALAGCAGGTGFHPLYGRDASGTSPVATHLAEVEIAPLEGRVGQQVRNELSFFFTGGGKAAPPRYRLEMTVTESNLAAVVDPFSSLPQVVSLSLNASFAMRPAGAGPSAEPVLKGNTFARASYTSSLQRFANIRAQRDAEDRAAKVLAEQIRTRVATYFATGR